MSDYQNIIEELRIQSDEELIQQLSEGNKSAFSVLYQRHWEELFITAARVLRGREGAMDVVQDVFVSFWNRRSELQIQGSLKAYLHTSVRYHCIHFIEKNITRRDYLSVLAETIINSTPADAETEIQLKQLKEIIHQAIEKMPDKMKVVYKLSRQEHLTHKQISEHLNISVETVRKHIQHALHLIRTNLPPHITGLIIFLFFKF